MADRTDFRSDAANNAALAEFERIGPLRVRGEWNPRRSTTMPEPQYTATKAWAAGGGGAIGPALSQLIVLAYPPFAPGEAALSIVLGGVLAAVGAYFARNSPK